MEFIKGDGYNIIILKEGPCANHTQFIPIKTASNPYTSDIFYYCEIRGMILLRSAVTRP